MESEKTEGEKIAKEISKLSFAKGFSIEATSQQAKSNKDKLNNDKLEVQIYLKRQEPDTNSYNAAKLLIKTAVVNKPKSIIDEEKKTADQIEELRNQVNNESRRLEKIGGKLANMDREERRARAMLVESKLKSMNGGDELISALIADLPEV